MSAPSRPRRALLAGIATATLGAAALGIVALGPAGAQEQPAPAADGGRSGVLDDLVAEGTITEAQADAIRDAVQERRQEHPRRGHRMRVLRGAIRTAAEAIGIEPAALGERLRAGESIAEVAASEGVDRQVVIDALVAAGTERLDQAVAAGRITEERAAQAAERLPDAAARLVDHQRTS